MGNTVDPRVIFNFNNIEFTVSDVIEIYDNCLAGINGKINDLESLYKYFDITPKSKNGLNRSEITNGLADTLGVFKRSVVDQCEFDREIIIARRKFIYWGDIDQRVYGVINELSGGKGKRVLRDSVPRNRALYEKMIACACYLIVVNHDDMNITMENDKCFFRKKDYEYIKTLKKLENKYEVDENLEIDTGIMFEEIYDKIMSCGAENVFMKLCVDISAAYNRFEKRIESNNTVNSEFPVLWHLCLKGLTDKSVKESNCQFGDNAYKELLNNIRQLIVLIDVDNQNDLSLLLPNQEENYIERLMNYSAVYDLHQYDIDGMLFLIRHIVESFSEDLEKAFGLPSSKLYPLLCRLIKESDSRFQECGICVLNDSDINCEDKDFIDRMASSEELNKDYLTPLSWNDVHDDSEWIIKKPEKYYILPPVLSMLGVYDKIGSALNWKDFGPQIEAAIGNLFKEVKGLSCYNGKYVFEDKVDECDAVIVGREYTLIIECKRKGLSRRGRSGDKGLALKDLSDTFFASQYQAYRMQRAIIEKTKKGEEIDFYPEELGDNDIKKGKCDGYKKSVDFKDVKHFIRISCTGGNFWIVGESGISDIIVRQIENSYLRGNEYSNEVMDKYFDERHKLAILSGSRAKSDKLDRLFISFDKLYGLVKVLKSMNKVGDEFLKGIWSLTRIQSKKGDTFNHMAYFSMLGNSSNAHAVTTRKK